jgi:hypothetical protein
MIAATALAKDLTVVTRNVRDFAALGVRTLSPSVRIVLALIRSACTLFKMPKLFAGQAHSPLTSYGNFTISKS